MEKMTLKITFFDVQHGNATYIKTPNGTHILHDLGTGTLNNNTEFSPVHYLKNQNVDRLNYLIISHPHKDHIEDILNIDMINPSVFTRPIIPSSFLNDSIKNANADDEKIYRKYIDISNKYTGNVNPETDPGDSKNNGGVNIETFKASGDDTDLNYYSLVTLISYGGAKILLTGDNNPKSINELMENSSFTSKTENIDILLTPHHGRKSSYVSKFVKHLNPILTIISDKKDDENKELSAVNSYSKNSRGFNVHHNTGSKERFCLTTRQDGTITTQFSNGNGERFLHVSTN